MTIHNNESTKHELPRAYYAYYIVSRSSHDERTTRRSTGLAGEIGLAEVNETAGVELGLGMHFTVDRFRITPMIGAFVYQGELDGFVQETDSICRDLSNGQFSDQENCDATEVEGFGKLEAAILFDRFDVGFGYRISNDEEQLYGSAGVKLGEFGSLRASVGEKYLALALTVAQ